MTRNGQEPDEGDLGQIDSRDCPHVNATPEIMSDAWCFEGTRLPVSALLTNLAAGLSLARFTEQFPWWGRPQDRADHIQLPR